MQSKSGYAAKEAIDKVQVRPWIEQVITTTRDWDAKVMRDGRRLVTYRPQTCYTRR